MAFRCYLRAGAVVEILNLRTGRRMVTILAQCNEMINSSVSVH